MAANVSFVYVCLLFIHLVFSELPLNPRKPNRQSKKSTLRNYRNEFFNEVLQNHYWNRKMRTLDPVASTTATCDTKIIAAESRKAKCKPRPHVVALEKIEGFQIEPSHVEAMRCKYGKCSNSAQHCLPKEKQLRKISVYAFKELATKTKENRSATCMQMEVEEHVSCHCICLIKPKDCQQPAIHSKTNCRCECPNRSEAHACEQNGNTWSQSSCRCIPTALGK